MTANTSNAPHPAATPWWLRPRWLVVLLCALLPSGWWLFRAEAETVQVSAGVVEQFVVARAMVQPRRGRAQVRPLVAGRVLRVLVDEGQAVEAGQLLAELDCATEEARLQRVQAEHHSLRERAAVAEQGPRAEVQARRAEVRAARQSLQLIQARAARQAELFARGAGVGAEKEESERQVEIAEARLAMAEARLTLARRGAPHEASAAQAQVAAARAGIDAARVVVDRCQLRAPTAGVVITRAVVPGDIVVSTVGMYAPVLFEVADLDQLEIVAEVVEWDAHRVHVGQIAEITGLGGKPVFGTGRVVRRGAAMTPPTVVLDPTMVRSDGPALPVTIELDEPLEPAPPLGMRVEAHIQVASVAVDARIPRAALGLKEGQAWVRLPRWFRAREVPVELGVVGRAFIEVQGLAVGTDVHVLRPEPTNVGADHAITL